MLIDLIKEFALLVDREGVLRNFAKIESGHPDYATLLQTITDDVTAPVLPEIKDFVFGVDANTVNERIRVIDNPFMLIDYGLFRGSNVFDTGGSNIEFMFSCIIAIPDNRRNLDGFESALWSNTLLGYIKRLLKHFEQRDEQTCAANRMLNGSFTITPIDPVVLLNCTGWDLSFSKNASTLLF